jgi:hypothetical protein
LLRYEDLVDASPRMLATIAEFIGHRGTPARWENPFGQLQRENPGFFREGASQWNGAPGWTPLVDSIFFALHGDLMAALGYADAQQVASATASLSGELREIVEVTREVRAQKRMFEQAAHERRAVIDVLDAEVRRLRGAGAAR